MKNIAIENMLKDNKMLAPRSRTDKLFVLPAGSFDYRGYLDDTVRLIEEIQLSDRPLWSRFVQVFADRPDGENRGWRGEYWGKMMRGAASVCAYTKDPALYEVLTEDGEPIRGIYERNDVAIRKLEGMEEKFGVKTNHESVIMSPVSGAHNGPWLAGYGLLFLRRDDEPLED